MKRNIDLIKLLLLEQEERTAEVVQQLEKFSVEERVYNSYLLIDDNFVNGTYIRDQDGNICSCIITEMTWKGHELLDALNSESALDKMKNAMKEGLTLGAFIEAAKTIGVAYVNKRLGLNE